MTDQDILDHLTEISRAATEAANALSEVAGHCRTLAEAMRREKARK